ncbi:MAG: shikimate dehydrogenase [Alphaproteobacteria bacterium]|nr:shikimate dehydrogenase [Alphaproteobacteria bacterium]
MMKACVIGWPVEHSLSPALHGTWLRQYGIAGEYVKRAVRPADLPATLGSLAAEGWRGCNLTVPHKEAALPLLDRVAAGARRIGAVNTVAVENGKLAGFNTDGFGFLENLRAAVPGFDAKAGPAVVLGAGGAARAIVDALAGAGAPEIRIVNRARARATRLGDELAPGVARIQPWAERTAALAGAALLVNATSLGMEKNPPLEIDLARLPKTAVVDDIVYAPLETALLKAAKARGNPTVDGLGMLLHQGRPGFRLWFGVMPEVTPALREAVLAAMGSCEHP